jgi:hypothetical protein
MNNYWEKYLKHKIQYGAQTSARNLQTVSFGFLLQTLLRKNRLFSFQTDLFRLRLLKIHKFCDIL